MKQPPALRKRLAIRARFGMYCEKCLQTNERQVRKLLPGQTCHCGYTDERDPGEMKLFEEDFKHRKEK